MSKELSKNTTFKSEIKKFLKENSNEILDVILFGSAMKGKENPKDIDLLILYSVKKNIDKSYEFKKILKSKGFLVETIDKTYKELIEGSFKAVEGILAEGFSFKNNNLLSQNLGYMNLILFKYDLINLNKSERMRFYYSLYGRTKEQKGIIQELNSIKFSDSIILCPANNSEEMSEYLNSWKIKHLKFPILIPSRLKNIL
ncbi:nucleotidyltransferase domain-containing protein [Candidatus Woesearchaeota archaeon]|jgi:predicted nucleotidyltransferase|nr:nucleotidyltransferase domain-containing protein [Candidatus Woesearchaeota archaeon]MBT3439008.1 nucleotidyltransferase domain-containing protein [Candidatus Woesearchaeota archaeon]MBT4058648.1 nucleotidyltransferase domain-containing protein [Candidatus Woesearchaeota archaeon]MBT4209231.1 nucleotidyltransferase domain-containing protein [Candidatus Woesearchaeota archaeon]MBT4730412.1 nucleotidyltransferase domain-containing protein [Candidatus Woesearchaeota archaeon]